MPQGSTLSIVEYEALVPVGSRSIVGFEPFEEETVEPVRRPGRVPGLATIGDLTAFRKAEAIRPAPAPATFGQSVSRGIDILQQLWFGGLEAAGEVVGSESLAGLGTRGRERNRIEIAAAGPRQQFSAISTPSDFNQWAKETIGEQIPIMAPSLAGAATGAAAGSLFPVIGTTIGAVVGAFVPSLAMGVGEVQTAIKERRPEEVAPGLAFLGGTAIAALDSALPGKLGSKLVVALGRET